MEFSVAIDGGTTNTRARVLVGETIRASATRSYGARDVAITGSNAQLRRSVAECVAEATTSAGFAVSDIVDICASGMLTSNAGLIEVPHVLAPAGCDDLAACVRSVLFEEISPRPISFVPGVKTLPTSATRENSAGADILRGEESEAIGILMATRRSGPLCILLPGSHTKLLLIDDRSRIAASYTTIGGELMQALAQHTILAGSIAWPTAGPPDLTAVEYGARLGAEWGLLRGGFTIRLADVLWQTPLAERTWAFVGLVAGSDWRDLLRWAAIRVPPVILIGGREPLRTVYGCLAQQYWIAEVEVLPESIVEAASARGALAITRAHHRT